MTIKSVKTTYEVELETPVRLSTEYRYPDSPGRDYVHEAVEVTGAIVTTIDGREPYVETFGYRLTKAGTRPKRQKESVRISTQIVATRYDDDRHAVWDTSAYDAVVAAVLAEITEQKREVAA